MSRLEIAIKQIEFARGYTLSLLEDIALDDWFEQPGESVSHIAWQVGHIAMAQYGLCLFRQRGRQPEDTELMSGKFRKQFAKGSVPDPDPTNNPTPDEIRATFDGVYAQALRELPAIEDTQLDEPVDEPFAGYPTRLGALLLCSHHELLHAGQIGMIRRMLGKEPVR